VVGLIITVGAVKVKYAVALFPEASITTTVLFDVAVTGTTKVTDMPDVIAPADVVVTGTLDADSVTGSPLTVALTTLVPAKPVPVMPTDVPLIPVVGDRAMTGFTTSDAIATLAPSVNVTE